MRENVITLVLLLGAAVWALLHLSMIEWNAVKICGACLAGVSLLLLVVARLQLGASFAVQATAHQLITTGIYAKIRNPIYISSAFLLVGIALVLENWVLLGLVLLLVPVQVHRARKEADVLTDAFGEDYLRYKAGTWF